MQNNKQRLSNFPNFSNNLENSNLSLQKHCQNRLTDARQCGGDHAFSAPMSECICVQKRNRLRVVCTFVRRVYRGIFNVQQVWLVITSVEV